MGSDSDSNSKKSSSSNSSSRSSSPDKSQSSKDSDDEEQKQQDYGYKNKRMSQFGQQKNKIDTYDDEINEHDEFEDKFDEKGGHRPGEQNLSKGLMSMEEYIELEEQIIRECQQNNSLWIDKDFPADNRALFRHPNKVPEWAREVKQIQWKRPLEISPRDARFMQDKEWDVKQGAFGESWFIGALVIISTRGEFIEKLFVDKEHFDMGFVTFQFFKNGQWRPVIVDTLLPYDQDSKLVCYGQNNNPFEYWIPLMEKAYSKLHGCYQNIIEDFNFIEGLTDLTGGVSEQNIVKDPDDSKKKQLWNMMLSHFNQKFYLGCVNYEEGKGTKNADTGPHGILENHHYGILDIREFPREDLKLIRIRNPWGADGGWNGPFSDDSEEWDRHRQLRDELKLVFKSKKQDGTWWMAFDHFCEQFNRLFICKVFPENWQTYSIESKWQGVTAGGICPPKFEYPENYNEYTMDYLQLDSDERWFNNPQFRIKVEKETKIFISLMQEDEKICKTNYIKCNFMVIANKNKKHRIWERPNPQDIIAEAITKKEIDNHVPQREITISVTLRKFEGKNYGYYMIIPNTVTDNKKEEQRPFWLRMFASENIEVTEMPENIEESVEDQWTYDNAGGRRKIEGKDNPSWCRNPQYFLNIQKPTHLKIILRKTGNVKKTRNVKIGMTICKFNSSKNKPVKKQEQNKKGQPIQQQAQQSLMSSQLVGQSKNLNIGLNRLINQTAQHLEAPEMEYIERKLQILPGENFKESAYISEEVAALYFNWNPTEGPFIIFPSLDQGKEERNQNFKLTIFSNNPVQLQKLDENKNAVLIGKWEQDISDGGCHLYEDPFEKDISRKTWTLNPKFLLQFKDQTQPAYLKVTLAIADRNWKAKTKNAVGGMIGIYLLEKRDQKMSVEHWVREPSFMPLNSHSEEYELREINKQGYFIMPTTYESRIRGQFILSVTSDCDFTLQAIK